MAREPERRGHGPLQDVIARLSGAGFQVLPALEILTHYVLERDGFVALVERRADGSFGDVGAPARLLDGSFAVLVWKQGRPVFVAKTMEVPATADLVDRMRRFDSELRAALSPPSS